MENKISFQVFISILCLVTNFPVLIQHCQFSTRFHKNVVDLIQPGLYFTSHYLVLVQHRLLKMPLGQKKFWILLITVQIPFTFVFKSSRSNLPLSYLDQIYHLLELTIGTLFVLFHCERFSFDIFLHYPEWHLVTEMCKIISNI